MKKIWMEIWTKQLMKKVKVLYVLALLRRPPAATHQQKVVVGPTLAHTFGEYSQDRGGRKRASFKIHSRMSLAKAPLQDRWSFSLTEHQKKGHQAQEGGCKMIWVQVEISQKSSLFCCGYAAEESDEDTQVDFLMTHRQWGAMEWCLAQGGEDTLLIPLDSGLSLPTNWLTLSDDDVRNCQKALDLVLVKRQTHDFLLLNILIHHPHSPTRLIRARKTNWLTCFACKQFKGVQAYRCYNDRQPF